MSYVSRYLDPALVEWLNHMALSARRVVEGSTTGLHRSALKGSSIEFRQHRFYVPGDEPRRLDWRVLGRTDRPYIKEYDEETNLRCALLLDASGSMAYAGAHSGAAGRPSSKFDYAARVVASLAYLMLADTESVGLAMFNDSLRTWIAPHGATGHLSRLIDTMERTAPAGASDPGKVMQTVADRLGRRSLVILISDCFAPVPVIRQGLARLRHDRHELLVIRVLHRDEVEFPFRSWTRMAGLESEAAQLIEPAVARQVYLENFQRHTAELEAACRTLGAGLSEFVTDMPLLESLTRFLRSR
jgi:uncharacterized protein (DUF58 family)